MISCSAEAKKQAVALARGTTTIDKATASIKKSTLAAKANSIAMNIMSRVFNMGTFILISVGISKLVSIVNDIIYSEKNLRQLAGELGSELSNTAIEIEKYKRNIEELKFIINDSSSSFNDVTQARVELMTIQDELIEKFGTEKGAIENITEAIGGQTNALNNLSRHSYYKAKNILNEKTVGDKFSDWLSFGSTNSELIQSNMDKMINTMHSSVYSLETTGNEKLDSLIAKSYNLYIYDNMYDDGKHFLIIGTLDEIQNKLYGIQELASNFNISTKFENSFIKISNDVEDALAEYKILYEQYVLYEKIFNSSPDNPYDEQFYLINTAKKAYNEAIKLGYSDKISEATNNYAKTLTDAISLATQNYDYEVADYFESMYPELQHMVGEWQFNISFTSNTNDLKNKVNSSLDLIDGVSDRNNDFSTEDILNFNPNVATQDQIVAYGNLKNIAEEYNLTIVQLINLLQKMGLVQSKSYQQLVPRIFNNQDSELSN